MSDSIIPTSAGLTVFDDENLRFLDREERWLGFSTQTQRHVTGKSAERAHPCCRRSRWQRDIRSGHGLEGEYRVFRERVRKGNRLVIYEGHCSG